MCNYDILKTLVFEQKTSQADLIKIQKETLKISIKSHKIYNKSF